MVKSKKKNLEEVKRLLTDCLVIFKGKEKNTFSPFSTESVLYLVYEMYWRLSFYEIVTHFWVKSDNSKDPRTGYNNPFAHIFLDIFWNQFTLDIRTLIDKGKRTNSLRRIYEKIKCNRKKITREAYLYALGLPYDYKTIIYREDKKFNNNHSGQGSGWRKTSREYDNAELSRNYHFVFDFLSGKTETTRNKDDTIRKEVFEQIECKFDDLSDIKDYVDKRVAHRDYRYLPSDINLTPTTARVKEGFLLLGKLTYFISYKLLGYPPGDPPPTPQYNYLENFDKPWATKEDLEEASAIWFKFREEAAKWRELEDFIP